MARSPSVRRVSAAPGKAGMEGLARLVPVAAEDIPGLLAFVRSEGIDLVVVGPEKPLSLGLADALVAAGVPVFGCSQRAAEIESSKAFSKALMARHRIPTAEFRTFEREERDEAIRFAAALARKSGRVVCKADGLAAGKGVIIVEGEHEAAPAVTTLLDGPAGSRLVVEEFLVGREASCMALVDGERVWPLAPCEDHKTIFDG